MGKSDNHPSHSAADQTIRKIRPLKKEDGEPFWRKDIPYDFLRAVFDDECKAFTNSYDLTQREKQTFARLYIDAIARSSKTSKVLRDKLLSDREAEKSMAMAYQDATAYEQLQDAPRLKTILKGAAEDRPEPRNLDDFKYHQVPRINPINLIFLFCQHASHIAELHFPNDDEFQGLVMKTNLTSSSRANAFLWLMWLYLESDFTEEGCDENPFGVGIVYDQDLSNQGVPKLIPMLIEEEGKENVDPQTEIDFGREKQAHRANIITAKAQCARDHQPREHAAARGKSIGKDGSHAAILPPIRPSNREFHLDILVLNPPLRALARPVDASASTRGAGSLNHVYNACSPAAPESAVLDGVVPRKPRPPTAHQLAVEHTRNQSVEKRAIRVRQQRKVSLQQLGFDECIARLKEARDVGLLEGFETREQAQRCVQELAPWPLLLNSVENGKSPTITVDEARAMGFRIMIFSFATLAPAYLAIKETLLRLKNQGIVGTPKDVTPVTLFKVCGWSTAWTSI
ncbi:Ino eighty subunit 1 [Apiospora phragmitis]|uniref:Ino eighty subunit 1 n=1 Tax=Apiospora phragmitis TaxID=2905665 RepID=A0ABR1SSI7_9PEZI